MSATPAAARIGWPRLASTGLLIAAATVLVVGMSVDPTHELGFDFRGAYLPAAHAVLHGQSPYGTAGDPSGDYVYPPQLAIALAPFTLVSEHLAVVVAVLVSAGFLVSTLAVLGIRDIRCYAVVFVWAPTWNELDMASVSGGLALLLALAWRYRESPTRSAFALALAVATKLFMWPLLAWAVAMRRARAAVLALVGGLGLTVASWAAIRFEGLSGYPALLRRLDQAESQLSYSFVGTSSALGLSSRAGHLLSLCIGGALLAGCVHLARRAEDLRSFTLSVAAALALTPILWQHYLLLLLVPLAAARPRFSAIWLLPIVLWVSPWSTRDPFEKVLPVLVGALMVTLLVARPQDAHRGTVVAVPA